MRIDIREAEWGSDEGMVTIHARKRKVEEKRGDMTLVTFYLGIAGKASLARSEAVRFCVPAALIENGETFKMEIGGTDITPIITLTCGGIRIGELVSQE